MFLPSPSSPRPLLPCLLPSRSVSDGKVIPAINFPLSPPKSPTIVGNISGRTDGPRTDGPLEKGQLDSVDGQATERGGAGDIAASPPSC